MSLQTSRTLQFIRYDGNDTYLFAGDSPTSSDTLALVEAN